MLADNCAYVRRGHGPWRETGGSSSEGAWQEPALTPRSPPLHCRASTIVGTLLDARWTGNAQDMPRSPRRRAPEPAALARPKPRPAPRPAPQPLHDHIIRHRYFEVLRRLSTVPGRWLVALRSDNTCTIRLETDADGPCGFSVKLMPDSLEHSLLFVEWQAQQIANAHR